MQELFQRLLDSSFMPHGHCFLWKPELLWLQAGADISMALAYFMISYLLFWFVRNRKDLAFRWMFGLGSMLFGLCAVTHLMDVWTIWHGTYWLEGSIGLVTGIGSIATAVLLIPVVPKALQLPTPSELRKANEALQEEVEQRKEAEAELAERARELDEAYKKLKETERMKDEFFANVSHELRTPLTLILSPVETMLEEESGALSQRHRQLLETAHNNSIRMLQMVNGLLDFSQLEIGEVEVDREPTNLAELTRSVYQDFGPLVERSGLEARLEIDVDQSIVEMDRYLYERILFNLLSNAVKFTPKGGEVDVSLRQEGDRIELSVADTGEGIPEDQLEDIFKDFRQVDASATRRFEGTGLGLSLVKEFTGLLGGEVTVDSTPGEGSTFTADLLAPAAESEEDPGAVERSWKTAERHEEVELAPRPATSEETAPVEELPELVLVEDNDEMAAYIEGLLADTCQLRRAEDGAEALRLVRQGRPEVVITDIMMPKEDGLSLCRSLKEDPATADIPVVMLTALTNRKALLRGWEAGADEYLFKPFHPRELVTRIRTLLRNIERRREAEATARRLEGELLRMSERERRRIGRDLHDGLASHLTGVAMMAKSLTAGGNGKTDSDILQEIVELAQEGARQCRAMAQGLNPVKLDQKGLPAALQTLAENERTRFDVECHFEQEGTLPELMEEESINLYWIAHEAVHNALTHGEADHIAIRLRAEEQALQLEVVDDGTGFSASIENIEGMGLRTMRYRTKRIGASLELANRDEGGVFVRCTLPKSGREA